jgi:hypothetical protein
MTLEFTLQNIFHYADVLAIPLFFTAFMYFALKKNKTFLEIILMIFVLCGFLLDCFFTYNFLSGDTL